MTLRPYQQAAVEAAISHMRRSIMPALLEMATGSGKSHVVAALAGWCWETQKKRVLCLQPSKELTEQNHAKYLATGAHASIYSASAGGKCLRHPVVYGTPGTVSNSLERFGDQFGLIILDEAHGITPTIREIVDHMRGRNPRIRIIGMTATPYRMGTGYIYAHGIDGGHVGDDMTRDPYFHQLLYRITTRELIDMGFLTPAHADPSALAGYDAGGLELNSRGQFDAAEVERVFEGRGRLTSQIVADVVARSAGRAGVMIFAATVPHAAEILESLPPENARMLGGDVNMRKADRERLVEDFKARRFKYLISVGTMTTGVDFTHVDVIAVLRKTESPGLLQQIIGRGVRLVDPSMAGDLEAIAASAKPDCLVLDYAGNVEFHGLQDDLFQPKIKVKGAGGGGGEIQATCPACEFRNTFSARENDVGYGVDDDGYFLDPESGERIMREVEKDRWVPVPAHYGRRCCGQVKAGGLGQWERCGHRWDGKPCPECQHENDIAARYCERCKAEIVDPNSRLQLEFARVKADPYQRQTDRVLEWFVSETISQAGNPCVKVEFRTPYRSFAIWLTPKTGVSQLKWELFSKAIFRGKVAPDPATLVQYLDRATMPETVTYKRQAGSRFFEVYAYNLPEDTAP